MVLYNHRRHERYTRSTLSRRYSVSAQPRSTNAGDRAFCRRGQQLFIPRPTTAAAALASNAVATAAIAVGSCRKSRRHRCQASRAAITYRSPEPVRPTISIGSAMKLGARREGTAALALRLRGRKNRPRALASPATKLAAVTQNPRRNAGWRRPRRRPRIIHRNAS